MKKSGFGIINSMLVVALLGLFIASFQGLINNNLSTIKNFKDITSGYFSGDSALVYRTAALRGKLIRLKTLVGSSPQTINQSKNGALKSVNPCESDENNTNNFGTGDYACLETNFQGYNSYTYVEKDPQTDKRIIIPQSEPFQGMNAIENVYRVHAKSFGNDNKNYQVTKFKHEIRVRSLPLYQFTTLHYNDLEIYPSQSMRITGALHSNKNIFLATVNSSNLLKFDGQLTSFGGIFKKGKYDTNCGGAENIFIKTINYTAFPSTCSTFDESVSESVLKQFNNMALSHVDELVLPQRDVFLRNDTGIYFNKSDLRVVLKLDETDSPDTTLSDTGIIIEDSSKNKVNGLTDTLNACAGGLSSKAVKVTNIYSEIEEKQIKLLDIDLYNLLTCFSSMSSTTGKTLSDETDGGLIFYFSIDGEDSESINNYGVRLNNSANIGTQAGLSGLTIVTDQSLYIKGDFNTSSKISTSLISDSLILLSSDYSDPSSSSALTSRVSNTDLTINSAIITGAILGQYTRNGKEFDKSGLLNLVRFEEDWRNRTVKINGSFIIPYNSNKYNGSIDVGVDYLPPTRVIDFDPSFYNMSNLPPLTPTATYLKEERILSNFVED